MTESGNKALIERFYRAFQQKDYQTMVQCYHPQATFRDEAFGLNGAEEIGAMWQMLCERGKDMQLSFSVSEDNGRVTAHWEALYTFSQTGRRVHNKIDASFEFRDGKIIRHDDRFNFWSWSRQALGLPGLLLGWTPLLKNKVQTMAMKNLRLFMKGNGR